MKLTIVGATGKSGVRLVRAGAERGHVVTALVRNGDKARRILGEGVSIRTSEFQHEAEIAAAMAGADVVINAAGYIADGERYVALLRRIVGAAASALGAGGRFWLFGGAALLDVPGARLCTLDLPGVPSLYRAHRHSFDAVRATALDWSMLCPGPMLEAPDAKPTPGLIVSKDVWPVARPAYTRLLPRPALSLAFKQAVPRMTIYYEDAAQVIMDHLTRAGALSRSRVGVALPPGLMRHKHLDVRTDAASD